MRTTIFAIMAILTISWGGMARGSEPITITVGGTGSGLGFMRLLGDAYSALHPEVTFKVLPSLGSAGGIRAVNAGAIDLAVASRRLKEQEIAGMKGYFLGESPFIFAVHPSAEVEDVTLAEVVTIYNGTMASWRDGIHIRRILRPSSDCDWHLLQNLSPELAKALETAQETEGLFLAVTDSDAVSYLERIRGSFGPSTLTMILAENRNVKILSFNGMQPGVTESGKNKYPLSKPYYLLGGSEPSAPVKSFIEFIRSDQGRRILTQAGVTPASEIPEP